MLAVDRQTEADGEVLFSYNAGARAADPDMVVACVLDHGPTDPNAAEARTDDTNAVASLRTDATGEDGDEPTEAEQRVTISLTPPEVMRYLLTSSADGDVCL